MLTQAVAGFLWLQVENRQAQVEEESQVKSPLQEFPGSPVVEHLRANAEGTPVQSLVLEDPTCCGAATSLCYNY